MSTPKYRFIATDEIVSMSDAERDLSTIHTEDHDPNNHLCDGCLHPVKEECWAERHGEEVVQRDGSRLVSEFDERDCHCGCHFLIDQCRFTQTAAKNDGRPIYQLETQADGWFMRLPAAVYDTFMELEGEERDEIVNILIAQAKHARAMQNNGENEDN